MEFLRAQILDYLRIYKLEQKGGEIRRPAGEAYNRFLEFNPGSIRELEAQLQLAYIKRITRTDESDEAKAQLIKTFHNLINIIKSKLEANETAIPELTKLLARAYHELAIALQNQDQYSDANTYFENAIDLRSSQNDPEVAYSIFQQFFNYRFAYRARKISNIDDLMPGWKDRLIIELQKNAMIFKEASDPDHYSTTLHNLAFVHQFLAEESESAKRFEEAKNEYIRANRIYENAKITREKLRDPRRIAQSNVRIAECKLGQARYELRIAYDLAEEADKLANDVKYHYKKIPQEKFRIEDLISIINNSRKIKRKARCP